MGLGSVHARLHSVRVRGPMGWWFRERPPVWAADRGEPHPIFQRKAMVSIERYDSDADFPGPVQATDAAGRIHRSMGCYRCRRRVEVSLEEWDSALFLESSSTICADCLDDAARAAGATNEP